jgi:hypothetical protein
VRAAEARHIVLEDAKDKLWKLEVEALLAEMQNTVTKMKIQNSDM